MTVRDFMRLAEDFLMHLEFHHSIEEQCVAVSCLLCVNDANPSFSRRHIFPILAKRMPQFRVDHQEEHDTIHKGMHELRWLAKRFKLDPTAYSPDEFRQNLVSWGPLLFYHLDAEVASLKPDILRRCGSLFAFRVLRSHANPASLADWTLQEAKHLPM